MAHLAGGALGESPAALRSRDLACVPNLPNVENRARSLALKYEHVHIDAER